MGVFDWLFGDDDNDSAEYAAQAARESSAEGLQFAREQRDYDRAEAERNRPFVERARQIGLDSADADLEAMRDSTERGRFVWDRYLNKGVAAEDQAYDELGNVGSLAAQDRQSGRAVADVNNQFNISDAISRRALAGVGVRQLANATSNAGVMRALGAAGAGTNARVAEEGKRIPALMTRAQMFNQNPNAANAMVGTSILAGNAATGNAGNAANAMIPTAQLAGSHAGLGVQAAGQAASTNMSAAGLYNTINSQPSGLGQMLGMGLGAWAGGGFKMPKFG